MPIQIIYRHGFTTPSGFSVNFTVGRIGKSEPVAQPKLRVLSLFAGIGGFDLGLERTGGFETVAFCEIEEFPRRVLAKHWPHVPCYRDVRELTGAILAADGIAVDVIVGGFPCQDISFAGKGAGLAGERSGLFYEVARLIGELGPSFVILENVGALLSRGLDAVLGTLASLGYDAEWHCIPASYVGAPHRRDRVWIVAYPRHCTGSRSSNVECGTEWSDANQQKDRRESADTLVASGQALADADSPRLEGWAEAGNTGGIGAWCEQFAQRRFDGIGAIWRTEPDVGRVANGIPDRAHRLKGLGNAVVPQIPELIGHAILNTVSRKGKPGGESPSASMPASGQRLPASAFRNPSAGTNCGGVGPHDCPAASFDHSSFHEVRYGVK